MKIFVTQVFVEDQEKALEFYTKVLGFKKKNDVPLGKDRWLTVTSPSDEDGVELLLEPSSHPAVPPFKDAMAKDGIPYASFSVDNLETKHDQLENWALVLYNRQLLTKAIRLRSLMTLAGI